MLPTRRRAQSQGEKYFSSPPPLPAGLAFKSLEGALSTPRTRRAWRRSVASSGWKPRFFVLSGDYLRWFAHPHDESAPKPRGHMYLQCASLQRTLDPKDIRLLHVPRNSVSLCLCLSRDGMEPLYLLATDLEEWQRWARALEHNIYLTTNPRGGDLATTGFRSGSLDELLELSDSAALRGRQRALTSTSSGSAPALTSTSSGSAPSNRALSSETEGGGTGGGTAADGDTNGSSACSCNLSVGGSGSSGGMGDSAAGGSSDGGGGSSATAREVRLTQAPRSLRSSFTRRTSWGARTGNFPPPPPRQPTTQARRQRAATSACAGGPHREVGCAADHSTRPVPPPSAGPPAAIATGAAAAGSAAAISLALPVATSLALPVANGQDATPGATAQPRKAYGASARRSARQGHSHGRVSKGRGSRFSSPLARSSASAEEASSSEDEGYGRHAEVRI